MDDLDYLRVRATEETLAASRSSCAPARMVHRELARAYLERATETEALLRSSAFEVVVARADASLAARDEAHRVIG